MCAADISKTLQEWPYDPQCNVRRVVDLDGSEKLQVRLPLGIEQYELDGRPDGLRPGGRESYLELYLERLGDVSEDARQLSAEECELLHEEGVLYYFRYLLCFQIGDYDRVIRDTQRNLRMFDFVRERAARQEDKLKLDQYRPYILRVLASAMALKCAGKEDFGSARKMLSQAIQEIEDLEEVPTPTFEFEKQRSLSVLRGMVKEMRSHRAPSEKEQLRQRLRAAVEAEDYERAAKLRDVLRAMDQAASLDERPDSGPNEPKVEKQS